MRKTKQELNELCSKLGVNRLYSWSKVHSYQISPYEYLLQYILHKKEDNIASIYASSGGFCHDILEKYYKGELKYEELINEFEDAIVTLEVSDLKFDRSDEEKNAKIKEKYFANLRHFFMTHDKIETKVILEQFVTIKVGKYYLQGYIDLVKRDDDGNYIIQDWKSSSIYTGKKAIEEAGQLILYAESLRQLGIPIDKIKICWDFLKYVSVTTHLKKKDENGNYTESVRQIERCKIGENLQTNAKMWLKEFGYSDDLDFYLNSLNTTNNIECLPKEVQEMYTIKDCYVFVDLTEELINNTLKEVENTISEIEEKEAEYDVSKDEKLFWDLPENVEKQSYYFANLCGYSANLHKPYAQYLDKRNAEKDGNNLFGGVGKDTEDDLAWLNSL